MCDKRQSLLETRHSFYESRSSEKSVQSKSETFSKSDINIVRTTDFPSIIDSGCVNRQASIDNEDNREGYYKKYEHDEVPVKDSSSFSGQMSNDAAVNTGKELTNSDLDKMEIKIFQNMSRELQTDESSTNSLESNIKLFKCTVQEIFDNFYNNMHDFEEYKKKFHDILAKNKEDIVEEMEDFIKDMIQHIISSDSSVSSGNKRTDVLTFSEIGTEMTSEIESSINTFETGDYKSLTPISTVEAYKNENYLTDSTFDKQSSRVNRNDNKRKTYNIYLLNGSPCVEIKLDGRNLVSEINIRNPRELATDQIASAENIKSVAAKKQQMETYMTQQDECQSKDKIIPVKISYAKKNILSGEDIVIDENNKSFIFKICNYLCRRFRKHSFG